MTIKWTPALRLAFFSCAATLWLGGLSHTALGQEAPRPFTLPTLPGLSAKDMAGNRAVNEPRKLVYYISRDGEISKEPEAASQKVEVSFRDSVSGIIRQYYLSGKLRHLVPFAHIPLGIRHGVEMTFGEAGQMLTRQEFVAGKQHGEFLAYFADGKVERRIVFDHDRYVSIECFGRTGQLKNCKTEETEPAYPGGAEALALSLQKAIQYPPVDLQDGRGGELRLNIQVDSTGAIGKTLMMGSPSETMRDAVLKGVSRLSKFRKPARQESRPIAVSVLVLVNFESKKPGKGMVTVKYFGCVFPPYNQQK